MAAARRCRRRRRSGRRGRKTRRRPQRAAARYRARRAGLEPETSPRLVQLSLHVGDVLLASRTWQDGDELPRILAPVIEDLLGRVGEQWHGDIFPFLRALEHSDRARVMEGTSWGYRQKNPRPGRF